MEIVIFAIISTPLIMLLCFGWVYLKRWLYHWDANQTADRLRRTTMHSYDLLGNPKFYLNPKTGEVIVPPVGNPAYPIQRQYLMNNGVPKALENEPERTLLVNAPHATRITGMDVVNAEAVRAAYYGRDVNAGEPLEVNEGELRPASEPQQLLSVEPKSLPEVPRSRSFEENLEILRTCKQEGRGKEESIIEVTQLKSKGGKTFREYARAWDTL